MRSEYKEYPDVIYTEPMHTGGPGSVQYHVHDKYEFMYCRSGTVDMDCAGVHITLTAPYLLIIRPYTVHYLLAKDPEVYYRANLFFDGNCLDGLRGAGSRIPDPELMMPEDFFYYPLNPLQTERMECFSGSLIVRDVQPLISRMFLLCSLLSEVCAWKESDGKQTSVSAVRSQNYIRDVIRFLGDHYAEPLTAADVAGVFFVSVTKLNRDFRQHTQLSLHDFLLRIRLQRSIKMLATGDSVADTAHKCGFPCEAHYIRVFKVQFHQTPYKYIRG
ncbi:MAG: AraC family transcriptional regulator [Clostridia bacterium]|nr:AraC family transcriptional regulator [Clostridia bacterium]